MKKASPFQQWLADRDLAATTISGYLLDVQAFENWYSQAHGLLEINLADLTRLDVRDWRSYMETVAHHAPATINRRLQALHIWGEWLLATQQIKANPVTDTKRMPEPQLAPRWPERKQVAALEREIERAVNNARTVAATFLTTRDRAMILTLAHTGLRVSELCALEPSDLKLSERAGLLTVRHGKGNKQRRVPVNREGRRALGPWLKLRPAEARHVFTDWYGTQLTPRGVQQALQKYCRRAGVAITPHQLRHYLAKSLLDAGVELVQIAAILGHSSLDTTRIYTTPSERDLERALEKLEG